MKAIARLLAASLLLAGCAVSRTAPVTPVVTEAPPPIAPAPEPEPTPVTATPPSEPAAPPVEMTSPAPPPPPAAPSAPAPPEPVVPPAPRATPPSIVRPTPPRAPVPEPSPPPPVVAARIPHEDQVAQELRTRLLKTQEVVDKIDASKLNKDQREIFSGIVDFIAKAKEAYQAKDIPRAQVLADKAAKLADDLAQSVKR